MGLAESIGSAYKEADMELKRCYVGLFFQKFFVEGGQIKKALPSEQLKPLLGSKVQVRPNWLRRKDSNLQPRPYSLPDVSIGRGTISYPYLKIRIRIRVHSF